MYLDSSLFLLLLSVSWIEDCLSCVGSLGTRARDAYPRSPEPERYFIQAAVDEATRKSNIVDDYISRNGVKNFRGGGNDGREFDLDDGYMPPENDPLDAMTRDVVEPKTRAPMDSDLVEEDEGEDKQEDPSPKVQTKSANPIKDACEYFRLDGCDEYDNAEATTKSPKTFNENKEAKRLGKKRAKRRHVLCSAVRCKFNEDTCKYSASKGFKMIKGDKGPTKKKAGAGFSKEYVTTTVKKDQTHFLLSTVLPKFKKKEERIQFYWFVTNKDTNVRACCLKTKTKSPKCKFDSVKLKNKKPISSWNESIFTCPKGTKHIYLQCFSSGKKGSCAFDKITIVNQVGIDQCYSPRE